MISLPDRAAVERALAGSLPERLRDLLAAHHLAAIASGVADMSHYLVVQAGDTEADIVREVGFSPLVNPIDGLRFGTGAFHPWWDWLSDRDGWFEMIVTVGNSGFANILLIGDVEGLPVELRALCRRHAVHTR